ncbi:MAG: DUF3880 domain-containing protein [Desulfonatronovibrio sp.]
MHDRPLAVKIKTELEISGTVSSAPGNFKTLKPGSSPLFLGLGPDPGTLLNRLNYNGYYIECLEFEQQMPSGWTESIPPALKRITPDTLGKVDLKELEIILYLPGLKSFPSFWSQILAKIKTGFYKPEAGPTKSSTIFVFGNEKSLLIPEICWEIEMLGMKPLLIPPETGPDDLKRILEQIRPCMSISVNLQGMDTYGENFAILKQLSIPAVLWLVDNPFHLLTKIKSRFWTQAHIFVTDHWFINPLRKLGAQKVYHLPLAAGPGFFRPRIPQHDLIKDRAVFVGRSSFPENKSFFAAAVRNENLEVQARQLINQGHRPDFSWWAKKLKVGFWPENKVRDIGLGADISSQLWKKQFLEVLARKHSLTIFGDSGWKELLPQGFDIREEVDYYGPLASIYSSAKYVVNLTSMLLPWGLTQRHFDVWAARGFLITDKTQGLDIFPQDLVQKICFSNPDQMLRLVDTIDNNDKINAQLTSDFRDLIKKRHTYRNRLERIFNLLELNHLERSNS